MSAKLGIGIISFAHGHVSAYAHHIKRYEDTELIACWDHDVVRGEQGASSYDIPFVPHLEDLLKRKDIQAVIIASETNRHAELTLAALDAGKAVLLQKPMAMSLEECDRIIEAVDRTGCWFSMAFQMRTDPQNIHMKRLLQEGAIGKPGFIRRRHCIPVLFNKAFVEGGSRWHISAEANRGMFFDDATHALDWLYWMLGERPVSVMAEIDNVLTDVAPDDTGLAIYRYAGRLFAEVMNASVTLAAENTTEIYGDQGVIIQNHGDLSSSMVKPPNPIAVKLFQSDKPELGWQDQGFPVLENHGDRIGGVTRPFIDALRAGVPLCSARDGRVSVEMCLAAYESAASGRRILFPDH